MHCLLKVGSCVFHIGPCDVTHMNTFERFGKVDGRFPHWVTPYTGERYSIIYYQTVGEVVPQTTAVFNDNSSNALYRTSYEHQSDSSCSHSGTTDTASANGGESTGSCNKRSREAEVVAVEVIGAASSCSK